METVFLCAMVTFKSSAEQEVFPIKISSVVAQRIWVDAGLRSRIVQEFTNQAYSQNGQDLNDCSISILKPEGKDHEIFLEKLKQFDEHALTAMSIDLSGIQYRSDA